MKFENFSLFRLAYTFGRISPNKRIRKVTIPTSITNLKSIPKTRVFIFSKKSSVRLSKSRIIAILMALFATRIVANSFFGFSSKLITIFWVLVLLPLPEIKFAGVREKKATSAPEIKAEQISSTKSATVLNTWEGPKAKNK
jgi:hypothetical protein